MAHFYEKDIENRHGKVVLKDVLHFSHENGFDGRAEEKHKEQFSGLYQEFLDSKKPEVIAAKKAAAIKAAEEHLAALKGEPAKPAPKKEKK
jgi:hypothetical protein